jgi:Amiloride-sensitive sodium channel
MFKVRKRMDPSKSILLPEILGIKFCGISDIKCYQTVIQESVEQNINHSEFPACGCLPSCTSISYDTEINQISMDDAAIEAYFQDPQYSKNVRYFQKFQSLNLK